MIIRITIGVQAKTPIGEILEEEIILVEDLQMNEENIKEEIISRNGINTIQEMIETKEEGMTIRKEILAIIEIKADEMITKKGQDMIKDHLMIAEIEEITATEIEATLIKIESEIKTEITAIEIEKVTRANIQIEVIEIRNQDQEEINIISLPKMIGIIYQDKSEQ